MQRAPKARRPDAPVFRSDHDLRQGALKQLRTASREAEKDGETFKFTVPSPTRYPYQWFWDSCFHAMVWSRFDRNRAADEVRSLLAWQRPDGFLPHVIFWDRKKVMTRQSFLWEFLESKKWAIPPLSIKAGKPQTTEQLQPPVIAQAVEEIVLQGKGDPAFSADAFLAEVLPKLDAYYRWLFKARDPAGEHLISIISPSESGLDFSPAFSAPLGVKGRSPLEPSLKMRWLQLRNKARGYQAEKMLEADKFVVKDVLVNSALIEGLGSLARLAQEGGDEKIARWAGAQRARSLQALVEKMYVEEVPGDPKSGFFYNLNGRTNQRDEVQAIQGLMPLILEDLPERCVRSLHRHLTSPDGFGLRDDEHGLPYPVPHAARSEPAFQKSLDRGRLWETPDRNSSPAWLMTDRWIARGLRSHGKLGDAQLLERKTLERVKKEGFREFYDPVTGQGLGATEFGWSTLTVLMMDEAAAPPRVQR